MILVVIVTFYPDKDLLKTNVASFIEKVDKVLIWENTPDSDKDQFRFIQHDKIDYCGDGVNSISRALNYAWRYCKQQGYDFLLTMDQDSKWVCFDNFLTNTVYNSDAPYGIWCPQINENKNQNLFDLRDSSITSGMLIPIPILDKIGGWDEFFIIDSVDTEFCSHARSIGVNIYSVANCQLVQRYGTPQIAYFWRYSFELRNDSPQRLYYIYRNYVIVMRRYPSVTSLRIGFKRVWVKKIKWILFFERQGLKKFISILHGIIDGYVKYDKIQAE